MKRRTFLLVVNLTLFLLAGVASRWDGTWIVLLVSALPLLYTISIVILAIKCENHGITGSAPSNHHPFVTILIPAKNEERVIGRAVRSVLSLHYHSDGKPNYEVLVIDDGSSDRTYQRAYDAAADASNLTVLRRSAGLHPGKAAVLNWALPYCRGEVIGVFDADARVEPGLLETTIPCLMSLEAGALQVRKQIINPSSPFQKGHPPKLSARLRRFAFLSSLQEAEMATDTIFQMGRASMGGSVELRGNGQLIKRKALDAALGWNDESIVDDLDLTTKLYVQGYRVTFSHYGNVWEEGVNSWDALWHQRVRWAQGSICRYLDYADELVQAKLPLWLKLDIFLTTMEFIGPVLFFYSLLWWLVSGAWGFPFHTSILLAPLVATFSVLCPVIVAGLRLLAPGEWRLTLIGSWLVFLYLFHWWPVILWSMLRIVLVPDEVVWHKSEHLGLSGEI